MKATLLGSSLLLFVLTTLSCGKKDNNPAPGPEPEGTKLERTGTTQLSAFREELKAAAAGNKILFAGGLYDLSNPTIVDIYDVSTHSWTTSQLKVPRIDHAAASAGNKVCFAGGWAAYNSVTPDPTNSVEIYDVSTGQWSSGTLSNRRRNLAAVGLQNKVFFAGGSSPDENTGVSSKVDIYDVSTGSWSQTALSDGRYDLAAAAIGNKVLFAGGRGHSNQTGGYFSKRVDIYDISTGTWSTAELSEARSELFAAAAGNKILFAGGRNGNFATNYSKVVDIYDVSTNTWSTATLSDQRQAAAIAAIGKKIVIAGGWTNVSATRLASADVYDASTNTWEILQLSEARMECAAGAAGNQLLIGGGTLESSWTKTVDIFTLK